MNDQELLKRITVNPEIFGGKPIIRGMRVSVELILSLPTQGKTEDAILADYPDSWSVFRCSALSHLCNLSFPMGSAFEQAYGYYVI
jgi:uncharacterized protein (DUF433 family)